MAKAVTRASGYPRGDETRARVVAAAIGVFGRKGYELASTREIAARAGVRPAALHYYFAGKAGLYHACLDTVTATIAGRVDPMLAVARARLAGPLGLDELIEVYCGIYDGLLDSFYAPDEGISIGMLLGWSDDQHEVQVARHLMRDRVNLRIFGVVSEIVGRILRRPADDLATGLHAFAASGIAMIFHLDQVRIRDATGWERPNAEEMKMLKGIVRQQSTLLLRALAAAA